MKIYRHGYFEYHVERVIGCGAFGKVYEVSLPNSYLRLALKEFDPQPHIKDASVFAEGELLRRFNQEMSYQTQCDHRNIVVIFVIGHNKNPFFVMPLADSDLNTLLAQKSLTKAQKFKAILEILDGLEYIHNKGLVHRDLKPQNILVFKGVCKISDFGLIKNVTPNNRDVVTALFVRLGTDDYMAPELAYDVSYSAVTDIFALGVVISKFELIELDKIVDKCTNRTVRYRYQSVAEVRADILKAMK